LSNVKRFNRKEFISGSGSLLQSLSKVQPKPISQISQSVLKDVVQKQYAQDVAQQRFNTLKFSPKPVLTSKSKTSISSSVNSRSLGLASPGGNLRQRVANKSLLNITPVTFSKMNIGTRVNSDLKQSSFFKQSPQLRQSTSPALDLRQSLKQNQALKQQTQLRQSLTLKQTFSRTPTLSIPKIFPPIIPPFKERKWSFGKLFEFKDVKPLKTKRDSFYVSSIEANIFNIRAKKKDINWNISRMGLSLRPLLKA
jgi:hypothetical protein